MSEHVHPVVAECLELLQPLPSPAAMSKLQELMRDYLWRIGSERFVPLLAQVVRDRQEDPALAIVGEFEALLRAADDDAAAETDGLRVHREAFDERSADAEDHFKAVLETLEYAEREAEHQEACRLLEHYKDAADQIHAWLLRRERYPLTPGRRP